jgi:choline dehydrogenase-like flavoprotein
MLPGSLQIYQPGAEVHYGGSLAMGQRTSVNGEVVGAPGLHAVDGAVLPAMPARHPTLTIMANAERIGTELAAAWKAD